MPSTPTPTTVTDTADGAEGGTKGIDPTPRKKPNGSYEENGGGLKHSTASSKEEDPCRDVRSEGLTGNSSSESGNNNVIEDASGFGVDVQPLTEDHGFEEEGKDEFDDSDDDANSLQEASMATESKRNGELLRGHNVASESDRCYVERSQEGEQESETGLDIACGKDAYEGASPVEDRDEQSEHKQRPLPSLPNVAFDQLINYPKRSLRAESFFDLEQIKDIKPIVLAAMGIGLGRFPDFEEDPLIRMVTTRTKAQLYNFAEVFVSNKGLRFLKKEIMRRALLQQMEECDDDTTLSEISRPRPKNWTITQCIDWLMVNPPQKDEHDVILQFDQQWRQQIRNHLGRVSSSHADRALAMAEFDRAKKDKEPRGKEQEGGSENEAASNDGESSLDADNQSLTGYHSAESEKGDVAHDNSANVARGSSQPENTELIPPSWPDVTHSQLRNYPKISLRAQSYFDILQLRAIKPVTLVAMGIGVPGFPDIENDRMIKRATARNKMQLYYPTDVFLTKAALPYLQKEILRRSLLRRLRGMEDDSNHNDIDRAPKPGRQEGNAPKSLPRISTYSNSKCRDWLEANPPPQDEHDFILTSAMQWRRQVREQLGWVEHKSKQLEEALAEFDKEEDRKVGEEGKMRTDVAKSAETGGPDPSDSITNAVNIQLEEGLDNSTDQVEVSHVINHSTGPTYKRQLAAAIGLNKAQAQAIGHFQHQLTELRAQIAVAADRTEFEIFVSKDTFKFNASHFVAYPGFRERLHGRSYRASVRLLGSDRVGRDGYVFDFGRIKAVAEEACKGLNEYILIPSLSEVLNISVEDEQHGGNVCGDSAIDTSTPPGPKKSRKRKRARFPGCIFIKCDDGSTFLFPRQDCVLLPIMHTTAEELAIFLYGKILNGLNANYLHNRGVKSMEVTVSEAAGHDAVFRRPIPTVGVDKFDVASFISKESIPLKQKRAKYSRKVHEQGTEV